MHDRPRITVKVGAQPPVVTTTQPSRVVLVGLLPEGSEWPSRRLSRALVKRTKDNEDMGVEHLRLASGSDLSALPGLASVHPTRMRDAAALLFRTGLPLIDVVIGYQRGHRPYDLWKDESIRLLEPFVDELPGTAVVMPDAIGPARVDRRQIVSEARLLNLSATLRRWKGCFAENFQLGFFDLPFADADQMAQMVEGVGQGDVGLVSWEGLATDLLRHGWRSAATVAAGLAVRDADPTVPLEGRLVELPGGRRIDRPRWGDLGMPEIVGQVPAPLAPHTIRVALAPGGQVARVLNAPTLRAPRGSWSVPLVRTAKMLHQRIVIAANAFVFRTATPDQALALDTALRMAVAPFVQRNIVRGPEGRQEPDIVTFADPEPARPALVAQIGVFLTPWLEELRFNVAVRPGEPPRLEIL